MRRRYVFGGATLLAGGVGLVVGIVVRLLTVREYQGIVAKAKAQELQRFLSQLDHELKNPLTAIRFALANLSAMTSNAEEHSAIANIEQQTLRISQLIADLRKLNDFGQVSIENIPFQVEELLQEAIALVQAKPAARNRSVSHETTPIDLSICGDKYLLLIAVYNLLDNAVKFTTGAVRVLAWYEAESAAIEISDSGPGISQEDLDHVWEELYRSPRTQHVPGSGLGLAMVKAIVERHGGSVTLESDINSGSVATIWLPATEAC